MASFLLAQDFFCYQWAIITLCLTDIGQGSGTFLAKGVMKPAYLKFYFRESHIIFLKTS